MDDDQPVCPFPGFRAVGVVRDDHTFQARTTARGPGQSRVSLQHLEGMVIRKDDSKSFPSKREPGTESALRRLIIRMSKDEWTSVTCWGSKGQVELLTDQIHVGDTIVIRNARPKMLPSPDSANSVDRPADRIFLPDLPTDTVLDLQLDGPGELTVKARQDTSPHAVELLRTPALLNTGNVFQLGLLDANMQNFVGKFVNFAALVKETSRARVITTKKGTTAHACSVRVFDNTKITGLNISIWGQENVAMAQRFVPRFTIVFFSGIGVTADTRFDPLRYRLSTGFKTVITPYPLCPEADSLAFFRSSLQPEKTIHADAMHDYTNIRAVREVLRNPSPKAGILLGNRIRCYLTSYNLDGPAEYVVSHRCATCLLKNPGYLDEETTPCCENTYCPQFKQAVPLEFHLTCGFSDGSGSLNNVTLREALAETFIGVSPRRFLELTTEEKLQMKWIMLMEEMDIAITVKAAEVDAYKNTLELLDIRLV